MKKRRKNKLVSVFAAVIVTAMSMLTTGKAVASEITAAEWQTSTVYNGRNTELQNYTRWASPVSSYLTTCLNGNLMRVQYVNSLGSIVVEYYDASYQLLTSKTISPELPIFGGFYETDRYYFLLTGQENKSQSPEVETYRITKYDKDWNRIASANLKDCNTTVPFNAGSARMYSSGKYLLIRTCHKMYKSDDGLNHQANVTIQVDMESMEITDSFTKTMTSKYGYVSHSFNQFIKVENNQIIALDHGDAYPRSIVLIKYHTDMSGGKFTPDYFNPCTVTDVVAIPGGIGENVTGASVGGFEIAESSYLVAGNSVLQDNQNLSRATRNVFVAAVDKNSGNVTMNWLTRYSEGEKTVSTPHMIKISDNKYIVLWSRNNTTVYYTIVNENGKQTGGIYEMDGNLSDCVPVIVNGKLVWYVWSNEQIVFYEIRLDDLSQNRTKMIRNGVKESDVVDTGNNTTQTPGTGSSDSGTTQTTGTDPANKEYTVTFYAGDGRVIGHDTMTTVNQKLPALPSAYRSGYIFNGWYTDVYGGTKITTSTLFHSSDTVYAKWGKQTDADKPKEYRVTFNANGGTISGNAILDTENQKLDDLPEATKCGYIFQGWYTNSGIHITKEYQFQQDMTVYAQWKQDFEKYDDYFSISELTDTTVLIQLRMPKGYTNFSYLFGTSQDKMFEVSEKNMKADIVRIPITNLSPNTTYYFSASCLLDNQKIELPIKSFTTKQAVIKEYTITFQALGGTVVGSTTLNTVNQKLLTLPSASRNGYIFEGWYTDFYGGTKITTSTIFYENCTVYAHWSDERQSYDSAGTDEKVSVEKVKLESVKSPSKGKMKVSWEWYVSGDGYQIAYSKNRKFPSGKTAIKNVNCVYSSKTISKLSKGKTYYVKVRAYKKAGGKKYYGAWSKVKKVKIKK